MPPGSIFTIFPPTMFLHFARAPQKHALQPLLPPILPAFRWRRPAECWRMGLRPRARRHSRHFWATTSRWLDGTARRFHSMPTRHERSRAQHAPLIGAHYVLLSGFRRHFAITLTQETDDERTRCAPWQENILQRAGLRARAHVNLFLFTIYEARN